MNELHYDIIADIHGRYDKLEKLMERLGYAGKDGSFVPPPGHRALFLGDIIDTKPGYPLVGGVSATLRAVKSMCDAGHALCLMGNHELNAILYHTNAPDHGPLKENSTHNTRTHQGTLDDFLDYAEPASEWRTVWLPWLKTLPISLDLGGFRAVHACWHSGHLEHLANADFTEIQFLINCADKTTPDGKAIEAVLKGIEVPLPEGHTFFDHTDTERGQFRARWWESPVDGVLCCDLVFPADKQIGAIPVTAAARKMFLAYPADACPVFFGHYLKPANTPAHPECPNVACLDHSAATDGPLVAYRFNGEATINPDHYISHL
ncbi:hypothetical protein HQ447_18540 [bacterium]|nr:hypothetical protein [bacterium]